MSLLKTLKTYSRSIPLTKMMPAQWTAWLKTLPSREAVFAEVFISKLNHRSGSEKQDLDSGLTPSARETWEQSLYEALLTVGARKIWAKLPEISSVFVTRVDRDARKRLQKVFHTQGGFTQEAAYFAVHGICGVLQGIADEQVDRAFGKGRFEKELKNWTSRLGSLETSGDLPDSSKHPRGKS
jgi:hypothetical protein